jgi:succinoglycan biosynthesis transport protein ExoP
MFEASGYGQSAVIARRRDVAPGFGVFGISDFGRFWSVLWEGKGTIMLSVVVALLLAAAFVLLAPRKYTATTQILMDPMDLRAAQADVSTTIPQSDAAVLQVESQARVIGSDNILRRVVESEGLDHDPEFESGAKTQEQIPLTALNNLRKHVDIKRPERTYVIEVSVTSEDPAKAARIANAIAQTYLTEQTEVRADAARQVSQSLSGRLKELQDTLRVSENKVETYKSSHNIVGANGELVNEQQLVNLNTELSAARARTAQAKGRLDQIENVQRSKTDIGAFPEAVQSATITALRTQYTDIMRREAEQKSSLGERHPAVMEIEAQAERVHKLIEDEVNRIALSARTEYESAKTSEDLMAQKVDALKNTAESTNQSLVGLRELEREAQANRTVYESFLVRARETGEQEQIDTKNIRIISRADPPLTRSSPPPSLLIGLAAMMLGGACGTGIVLMRSLNETDRPRSRPVVAKPARRFGETMRNLWPISVPVRLWPRHGADPEIRVLAELPPADISYGLDALENPNSRFAREIQKIYDAVRESHGKRANPSVLVVAADDQDDTASVALALAAAIASTQRVLLIDADLQRRTLSAIDADESDAGLVDVAVGRRELSEVIVRDHDTNINTVAFVAPSSRRDRPISDADVRQAFDKTKRFDMVIVAAIDLSRNPSTLFFAGLVDHIVLVVRPDEEDRRAAEQFISRLGPDAMKVRGAVLTGVGAA